MQKLLKLQHHRHTGRVIHHRHTSYRALAVVVVLAGACMLLTNKLAQAASYDVSAQILAPVPAAAPVITTPQPGAIFNNPNVTIGGSCPMSDPRVMIVIYEGATALGSQQCSAIGSFAIPIVLHAGAQQLVATVVTITSQTGASSTPLTVHYIPGAVAQQATTSQPTYTTTKTPRGDQGDTLEIRSRSPFLVYGPSKPAVWEGSFAGGLPPYTASIAWGDGKVTWLRNAGNELQTISHSYDEVRSSYRITITLRDSAGHELQMRITAVSPATTSASGTSSSSIGGSTLPFSRPLYITYLLTIIALLALWAIEHATMASAPKLAPARATKAKRRATSRR